jgi:DNA-binding response OmpR family regulator
MRILFIEDDPVLADIVIDYLEESYTIDHAFDTHEAQALIDNQKYELFIFDVNIPFKNGIEFLRDLRSFNILTPAIMLTAYDDTAHIKSSFDAGAHDYICKPFELEELKVRIERSVVLFRIDRSSSYIVADDTIYYPKKRLVTKRGVEYTLRPKDAEILDYFIANPHRLITSDELSQNIWEFDQLPSDATLRSYIRNIRNIIGAERIKTQRGVGYIYE